MSTSNVTLIPDGPATTATEKDAEAKLGGSTNVVVTDQPTLEAAGDAEPEVKDYRQQAIYVMMVFCVPFGIVAYIKAKKSMEALERGDRDLALKQSKSAGNWVLSGGLIGGLITFILLIALIVLKVQNA